MAGRGEIFDAIVVGGGPGGLAAALWLGRYRRKTLVIDAGEQRNSSARLTHGYLTLDGATPHEILGAAAKDLLLYDTVETGSGRVTQAAGGDLFRIDTDDGRRFRSQRVLLATGVKDEFPDIDGFDELFGRSIFHCSCCDGYEARGKRVLAIGWEEHVGGFALDLLDWGARVTLLTTGKEFRGDDVCVAALQRHEVPIIDEAVEAFDISDGTMTGARLASGETIEAEMAFFSIAHHPRGELAAQLGCAIDDQGYVTIDEKGRTTVEGVYAVGDVTPGEQLIQIAAAHGALAGIACAMSLRGSPTPSDAPDPGPDPETELEG